MTALPGIQRDGTALASNRYTDGEWVRFQRGLPRKIGGYTGSFLNATGISRGMHMSAANGLNYVVSGYSAGLEQWVTDTDNGIGTGPYAYSLSNFTVSDVNLWQFDIGYDSTGSATNNLVAHPGQNLLAITSTVDTPVLRGVFPGTPSSLTMSKVGVFTAAGSINSTTTFTLSALNARVGAGQTITGSGIPSGTTVVSVTLLVVVMSAAATTTASITATFDNNIAVSGGCVVLHPYLFIYGNNGLIQNSSAGDFDNWVSADANANNTSTGKIVCGLPLRGGSSSPSGLFWSTDALVRVSFAPTSAGGQNFYWTYDLISSQTSIMSSRAVIEYDGIFYWAGVDRFLMYNGVVQEIPNDVNQNYFFDNLNFVQRQKVWATKIPRFGEIWWFYPKGAATECTDAKPGIVGQRRQARRICGSQRLDPGIALEAVLGLVRLGQTQRPGRDHLDPERRQQFENLAQLALVVAGQDQPGANSDGARHHAASIASRCIANSRSVPTRARRINSKNCASLNGSFSAVPWISTMPPPSVRTKLASASASLSSA